MKMSILAKQAKKLVANNAPAILTSVGVAGALTTAYLVGKASFKAAEIIDNENKRRDESIDEYPMELSDKFEMVWREYVPAAAVAALTVAAIIGSNHISTRRAAAMASALTVSDKIFTEYKKAVVDKIGEKKEQEVHDKVVTDQVENLPKRDTEVVIINGDVLCMDARSGRTFTSNMEDLRRAVNDVNQRMLCDSYVSLSEFYDLIGLDATDESSEVGWRADDGLLEPRYTSALTKDSKPCLVISFDVKPHYRYDRTF